MPCLANSFTSIKSYNRYTTSMDEFESKIVRKETNETTAANKKITKAKDTARISFKK